RARVDHPVAGLVPGQFVRVQLAGSASDSLLVPEKAIATDQGQRFVLVVGSGGEVAYRPVQLGALHGDQRVVLSGVSAGEQVIVSGLMKVRPGMKVSTQPGTAGPQAQAADASKT
ncbi:MAG TPA: efflux transporter periplasmic adaptor subunit, partial [Ramlibacter sp.]